MPTLFDELAVALVATPNLVPLTPMYLEVANNGLTKAIGGRPPNAQVALTSKPSEFLGYFTNRLAH